MLNFSKGIDIFQ